MNNIKRRILLIVGFAAVLVTKASANPIILWRSLFGDMSVEGPLFLGLVIAIAVVALCIEFLLVRAFLSKSGIKPQAVRKQFLVANLISFPITQILGMAGPLMEVFPILFEYIWYSRKFKSQVSRRRLFLTSLVANTLSWGVGTLGLYAMGWFGNIYYEWPWRF